MPLDPLQQQQEDEYSFPYHYVVKRSNDGFSQCFNDIWGINYLATIEYLLQRIERESFTSVVDVGCGDGRFTKELGQLFPDRRVTGLDFSPKAIALAGVMAPGIDFRCIDIMRQSIEEKFDIAVLMEVYEHISPDICLGFCSSLAALINCGGILYLTVPHVNKGVEYKHYRHFTSDILVQELSRDFELLDLVFIEKRSYIKRLIDSILTNRFFILNNKYFAGRLYAYYKDNLFLAEDEASCQRIVVRARRRSH